MSEPSNINDSIKEKPHWRIIVRPLAFEEKRVSTLDECWKLVDHSRVALRGWDFPHVDENTRIVSADSVASSVNFTRFVESWKMFQSGQFAFIGVIREEFYKKHCERYANLEGVVLPEGMEITGYLSIINALYHIAEVFEFAARLYSKMKSIEGVSISAGLHNAGGRMLYLGKGGGATYYGQYVSKNQNLVVTRSVSTEELLGSTAELTLQALFSLLEQFGWLDVRDSTSFFTDELSKFRQGLV